MFNFLKRHRFRISIALILISFFLILVGQTEKGRMENWFTSTLRTLVYPFQASGHWAIEGVTGAWTHYIWLIGAAEENDRLRREVAQFKEQSAKTEELRQSYDRLLTLLQFQRNNPDEKVFAQVIGEVNDSFSRLMIINRGSNHGIKKNFGVITPLGAVGKIQSVTPFQSVVQLIVDSRTKIPALVQRTRLKAIVQGELDGRLMIRNFPRNMSVQLGDMVVTSGLEGIFPKGVPIGRIFHIEKKEYGLFQTVTLTPIVPFNRLEEVAVILLAVDNIHHPLFTGDGP